MVGWLQDSPEQLLRSTGVTALPMAALKPFAAEHFPQATCKADLM